MRRREFLLGVTSAVVAAGAGVWAYLRGERGPRPTIDDRAVLPALHKETLGALAETLLPRDADAPGADAVGVMTYVERELSRPDMKGVRLLLMRGATQLDRVAQVQVGKVFRLAAPDERDRVIEAMLAGEGMGPGFEPPRFIRTMLALSLEGLFGDPVHGGNMGGAGWRFAGYDMGPPRPLACQSPHGACE
jgi:hypothetical protein